MRFVLLSLAFVAGCATSHARMSAHQLDSLSFGHRAQVDTARARADDAAVRLTAAQEVRSAALRYLEVSLRQDEAAQSLLRAQAINASTDLRAVASQSKIEYARRLVFLRDAELQLRKDELRLRNGELELTELRVLRAEGHHVAPREPTLIKANDHLRDRIAADQRRLADRTGEVETARIAWEARRRAADYAQAAMPNAAPPRLEPATPIPQGANEGTTAGSMSLPSKFPPP
jgi:hypothetical protein